MAWYVSHKILLRLSILPCFPPNSVDFMALNDSRPQGCFAFSFTWFRVGNTYAYPLWPLFRSVTPITAIHYLDFPYLVAGDFNIDNPAADPLRALSFIEERESAQYFAKAGYSGFSLLNEQGPNTHFPFSGFYRPRLMDLAFANCLMFPAFRSWDNSSLPSGGSNHIPMLLSHTLPNSITEESQHRWLDADCPAVANALMNLEVALLPRHPSPAQLHQLFFAPSMSVFTTIIKALALHSHPSPWSKPRWTPLSTSPCRVFTKAMPTAKEHQSPSSFFLVRASRSGYLKAIKKVKLTNWADFVAKSSHQNI